MADELHGKRIAILAADGVERVELEQPRQALQDAGATTVLLSLHEGEIKARENDLDEAGTFSVDALVESASADEYDALLLPGGTVNPDQLRVDTDAVGFVRDIMVADKPVAAICHGPWLLVESGLAKGRKVQVVTGFGTFAGPNTIAVEHEGKTTTVSFDQCIIAAGSEPVTLPFVPHDDPRVIDSTGALELEDVPERLLVLGGGIIGLEMACVYDALGSSVTVVELMDQIIPGADKDIVKPLHKRIEARYEKILLKTKLTAVSAAEDGLTVTFEDEQGGTTTDRFDKILVSVGRRPNGKMLNAGAAGVAVDDRGFIAVDSQQRTNVAHIFAIGDVVGQPMLAHKAVHEGKVAAEVAAGHNRHFDARVIPSVAYTDPEVAWVGMTETTAKAQGIKVGKGVFPWAASGRSLALGRSEGITKVIFDETDDRVIGAAIVGPNAGDLIAEVALAIEMGADAVDLGHTIHPHPTLSETINFAAEMFEGTITDLIPPRKRH